MKRAGKKLISVLLIFTLLLSIMSVASFATPVVDLTLTSSDDLSGYSGNSLIGSVTFVTEKNTVLKIPQWGFSGCKNLKSVTFTGEGDVTILPDAFCNNLALEKITFENNGDLEIYKGSFSDNTAVGELSFNVGGSVTIWGVLSFTSLGIEELYLPSNISFEGYYEDLDENYWSGCSNNFNYCESLKRLVIGCNSGFSNFSGCDSLESIYFTEKVNIIDSNILYTRIDGITVYGYSDSASETYAKNQKYTFIPVDSAEFSTITSSQSSTATIGIPTSVTLSVAGFPETIKLENPLGSEFTFAREDAEIVTNEAGEQWTVNLAPTGEADTYTVTADYGLADLCATDEITVYAKEDTRPPVISAETITPAVIGETAQISVTVKGSPLAIRFVDDNTTTIDRESAQIVKNDDNTETWTVNLLVNSNEQQFTVYTKDETGWLEQGTDFTLTAKVIDYSTEIKDFAFEESLDGVIYNGVNKITLTTANGIVKVQFMKNGNTWTFTEDNSEVVEVDGQKYWTIRMNFCTLGDNTYDIRVRSAKSSFETTDTLNVTVYSK